MRIEKSKFFCNYLGKIEICRKFALKNRFFCEIEKIEPTSPIFQTRLTPLVGTANDFATS